MKSRSQQLVSELFSLYHKYGRDAFLNAARELRSRNITEAIAATADALYAASVSKTKWRSGQDKFDSGPKSRKRNSKEVLLQYISELESSGDQNKVRVASLLKQILRRELLGSSSSLRGYLESIGLSIKAQKLDRYRAAKKIADYLGNLPQDRAKETIAAIEQLKNPRSSLQEWTDVIVARENR
jgi:hypothetical protein